MKYLKKYHNSKKILKFHKTSKIKLRNKKYSDKCNLICLGLVVRRLINQISFLLQTSSQEIGETALHHPQ